MKIQYCSDLHLEFEHNSKYMETFPLKKSGEVLILAGDIIPLHDEFFNSPFFNRISELYDEVFWVPGNHEFYYCDIKDYSSSFEIKLKKNVRILHNKELEYKGVRFVFSTMWSKISPAHEKEIEQGVSDYACILNNGKKLKVKESNQLHNQSMLFLKEALNKKNSKTVVVTHHLPSDLCNSPEYRNSPVNEAFCTDYNKLIFESGASFWIYGHSHFNQKPVYINKTILLTNQLGYVKQNEQFDYRNNAFFVL